MLGLRPRLKPRCLGTGAITNRDVVNVHLCGSLPDRCLSRKAEEESFNVPRVFKSLGLIVYNKQLQTTNNFNFAV